MAIAAEDHARLQQESAPGLYIARSVLPPELCQQASAQIIRLLRGPLRHSLTKVVNPEGFCQVTLSPNNIRARFAPAAIALQEIMINHLVEDSVVPGGWGEESSSWHRTAFGNYLLPGGHTTLHRDRRDLRYGTAIGIVMGERAFQVKSAAHPLETEAPSIETMPEPHRLNAGDVLFLPPNRPWHIGSNPGHEAGIAMPVAPEYIAALQ